MHKENKHLSFEEVLTKLIRYCDYQARSEREAYLKAKELMPDEKVVSKIIDYLKQEKYIDDSSFALVFAKGKMNQKKWGKYKIKEGLKQKGVSSTIVDDALSKIDQQQYIVNLQALIEKRTNNVKLSREEKAKTYRYLLNKGYESNLILELIG